MGTTGNGVPTLITAVGTSFPYLFELKQSTGRILRSCGQWRRNPKLLICRILHLQWAQFWSLKQMPKGVFDILCKSLWNRLAQRFPNFSWSGPTWVYLGHLATHWMKWVLKIASWIMNCGQNIPIYGQRLEISIFKTVIWNLGKSS